MKKLPQELKFIKKISESLDTLMKDSFTKVEIRSNELYSQVIKEKSLKRKFYHYQVFLNFIRLQHDLGHLKQLLPNYRVDITNGSYAWYFRKRSLSEDYSLSSNSTFEKNSPKFFKNNLTVAIKGGSMRSFQEKLILEKLLKCDHLSIEYEKPINGYDNSKRYPDFYVINNLTNQDFFWEHFGQTNSKGYLDKMVETIDWYKKNGFKEVSNSGNLIYTIYKDEKTFNRDVDKFIDLIVYGLKRKLNIDPKQSEKPFIEIFISALNRKRENKSGYYYTMKYKNISKDFSQIIKYSSDVHSILRGTLDGLKKLKKECSVKIYSYTNLQSASALNSKYDRDLWNEINEYKKEHYIRFEKIDNIEQSINLDNCKKQLLELLN